MTETKTEVQELPVNQVVCGNAFEVLPTFPENSIDMIMFSPPYWGLRDYKLPLQVFGADLNCQHEWGSKIPAIRNRWGNPDTLSEKQRSNRGSLSNIDVLEFNQSSFCPKCGAWRGSFGLEPHPQLYIDHMRLLCSLLKRILKKTGSLWLNMGDTYFGKSAQSGEGEPRRTGINCRWILSQRRCLYQGETSNWLQPKQKLLIPERCAIALQEDGWILRNDVIWHKPNHMPASVKDRLTTSWEHLYFFVKSKRYFFALDAIRQPHKNSLEVAQAKKTKNMNLKGETTDSKDSSFSQKQSGFNAWLIFKESAREGSR